MLKGLEQHAPAGILNAQAYAQKYFPEEDPQWYPNAGQEFQMFKDYQKAFLSSMKEGGKKTINMNKTSEVLQGPGESPSQFLERLCEAFCLYTPLTAKQQKNQWMLNAAFVDQVQGDIRYKLQKLEGFAGMNTSQLLEVTTEVFVSGDQEAHWEAD